MKFRENTSSAGGRRDESARSRRWRGEAAPPDDTIKKPSEVTLCASTALLIKQTFHPHNSNVWTERGGGEGSVGGGWLRGFPLLIGWFAPDECEGTGVGGANRAAPPSTVSEGDGRAVCACVEAGPTSAASPPASTSSAVT